MEKEIHTLISSHFLVHLQCQKTKEKYSFYIAGQISSTVTHNYFEKVIYIVI
jgi:hypothetical protein